MSHRPTCRGEGFTLVELLVVIGIIAVLIAVLLPALSKARASASAVQCASNMRQVGLAILNYAGDGRGRYPFSGWFNAGFSLPATSWDDLIDSYLGGRLTQAQKDANGVTGVDSLDVLICPTDLIDRTVFVGGTTARSYSMNQNIGGDYIVSATFVPNPAFPPRQISNVKAPAATILLVEKPFGTNIRGRVEIDVSQINSPYKQMASLAPAAYPVIRPTSAIAWPHPGRRMNYLYCDGHVAPAFPPDTDTVYSPGLLRGHVGSIVDPYWNNVVPARNAWTPVNDD